MIPAAEDHGGAVRAQLGVPIAPRPSWRTVYEALNTWKDSIEARGVLVFHFSEVDIAEARAFSIADRPLPVIAINGDDSPTARIFSLLHEYAHVLIGRSGNCNLVDFFEAEDDARIERYCNAVAASTLLPSSIVGADPIVAEHGASMEWTDAELEALSTSFRVSSEVVLRRLLTLGKTTREFYRRKRDQYVQRERQATGGFMTWPQRAIRSSGHLFSRFVLDAYRREAITSADVAEYFGVRIKHLPEIERRLEDRPMLTGGER